jgi:hypothetical protein
MSRHQTNYDMTIQIEGHDNATFIFTLLNDDDGMDGSLETNIQLQFIILHCIQCQLLTLSHEASLIIIDKIKFYYYTHTLLCKLSCKCELFVHISVNFASLSCLARGRHIYLARKIHRVWL